MTSAGKKKRKPRGKKKRAARKKASIRTLLSAARAGGERVESGRFRLDWTRAVDKIQRFKLADPHRYVLELVQAAIASGATNVDIRMDADDMIMTFEGQPYTEKELGRVFDFLFTEDPKHARLKELALGINTSLGLDPKFVLVESFGQGGGVRLRMKSLTDFDLEPIGGGEPPGTTRIHVRERMSWKVVAEAFWKRNPEEPLLEESCRFTPVPVFLNGNDLTRPLVKNALAVQPFEAGGIRGAVAWPPTPYAESVMHVCLNGVRVALHKLELVPWAREAGAVAFLDNPALSRNASHTDVVRDAEYERGTRLVWKAMSELMVSWLESTLVTGRPTGEVVKIDELWPDQRPHLRLAARALLRAKSQVPLTPALEALLDVDGLVDLPFARSVDQLLAGAAGEWSPLRPFWEAFRERGVCRVVSEVYDLDPAEAAELGPVALGPVDLLRDVFGGKLQYVDEECRRLRARKKNRMARVVRRQRPVLPRSHFLVRIPVRSEEPAVVGEAGLSAWVTAEARLKVTFLQDGVPLETREIPDPPFAGLAVLDSPAFQPNDLWNGVREDQAFHATVQVLRDLTPVLLRALSEAFPHPMPPPELERLKRWTHDGKLPGMMAGYPWGAGSGTRAVRRQIDRLLTQLDPNAIEDADHWLWNWRLFYTLEGEAVSLRQVVPEDTDAPIRYVKGRSWGEGAGDGVVLLNLSEDQVTLLWRMFGDRLRNHGSALTQHRKKFAEQARVRQVREENLALAAFRRQEPKLVPSHHVAVVDLPAEIGVGQVGIPFVSNEIWVRFLIDGLPVCERDPGWASSSKLASFPLQAVVEAKNVEPNGMFDDVQDGPAVEAVLAAVRAQIHVLIAEIAKSHHATLGWGQAILWKYLVHMAGSDGGNPLADLPPGVLGVELVPTVSHESLSLNELREYAERDGSLRWTTVTASRQMSKRPILQCTQEQRDAVVSILGVRFEDYTEKLKRELRTLQNMQRGAKTASIEEPVALKIEIQEKGYTGELGIPLNPGTKQVIRIQKNGIPLEEIQVRYLPMVGVIDSEKFVPNADWTGMKAGSARSIAVRTIRRTAEVLVSRAIQRLTARTLYRDAAQAVELALQTAAGRRFQGQADLTRKKISPLGRLLADAPVWPLASGERTTLMRLSEHCKETGVVWEVLQALGRKTDAHLIVCALEAGTHEALKAVFGDAVQDGTGLLEQADAAHRRRQAAPPLNHRLGPTEVLVTEPVSYADDEVHVHGQVGPPLDYTRAAGGILVRVGVDGRELCRFSVDHPLRGFAVFGGEGLQANTDWDDLQDLSQRHLLTKLADEALWQCVHTAVIIARRTDRLNPVTPEARVRRVFLLEALHELWKLGRTGDGITEELLDAPLFVTVGGRGVSPRRLQSEQRIRIIDAALPAAKPDDKRMILRVDVLALSVLEAVAGEAIEWYDEQWQREQALATRHEDSEMLKALKDTLLRLAEARPCLAHVRSEIESAIVESHSGAWLAEISRGSLQINRDHEVWKATKNALMTGSPGESDPVHHLTAAVLAGMIGGRLRPFELVKVLGALADFALEDARAEA